MATYFLGANTPDGFLSRYDGIFRDNRIRKTVILKGGPGCGKSTLMRSVGALALDLGCETEEILCSSDPDSLDGLIIPAAGLALADGTAPHIVEPPLCGCGAEYLDLGSCYDAAKLLVRKEQLFSLKAKNAACYPFAAAAFSAAAAAQRALHALARPEGIEAITVALGKTARKSNTTGRLTKRFYTAFSPKGACCCELPVKTVWTLKDNFGAAPTVLSAVAESFLTAGYDVIEGSLPLTPGDPSHILIPELQIGYAVVTEQFSYPYKTAGQYDLDALCMQKLATAEALHAQRLLQLRELAVSEGLKFLKEAKEHHDALEAACKDAVDFEKVDRKTAKVRHLLLELLAVK